MDAPHTVLLRGWRRLPCSDGWSFKEGNRWNGPRPKGHHWTHFNVCVCSCCRCHSRTVSVFPSQVPSHSWFLPLSPPHTHTHSHTLPVFSSLGGRHLSRVHTWPPSLRTVTEDVTTSEQQFGAFHAERPHSQDKPKPQWLVAGGTVPRFGLFQGRCRAHSYLSIGRYVCVRVSPGEMPGIQRPGYNGVSLAL